MADGAGITIEGAGVLLTLAVGISIACRKLRLPYTVGLTLAGFALAISPIAVNLPLTKDLIYTLLLPPLVFEAAHQIEWSELRRDFGIVTTLATVGVLLSAGLIAFGMHQILGADWGLCLVLAVLVSATDPVAVIATFKDAGVTGRLRLLVEAESLFNDGTAAVLFTVALGILGGAGMSAMAGLGQFALTVTLGLAMGALVGFVTLFLAGKTDDHIVEAGLTTIAAYGSFIFAEHFHASGVLAALTAGLILGNLGSLGSFTDRSRELLVFYWEYVAFLANSLIFLLIGMRLAHREFGPVWLSLAVLIGLSLVGRALAVYVPLLAFSKSRARVDMKQQHILVWGGLRGALALALVLGLPESIPWREQALSLTFGVVAFSVLVQGLTVTPLLRKMGLLESR